jgi:hypothetical protein
MSAPFKSGFVKGLLLQSRQQKGRETRPLYQVERKATGTNSRRNGPV